MSMTMCLNKPILTELGMNYNLNKVWHMVSDTSIDK